MSEMGPIAEALGSRYRIEREIAQGGMATVYLARDAERQERVAIKIMHPDLVDAIGTERFFREMGIAASLDHPCIVPLYDSGKAGSVPYYIMPYVEGDSLYERLQRERRLPIARRRHDHPRHRRGPGVRTQPRRAAPGRQAGEHPAGGGAARWWRTSGWPGPSELPTTAS